MSEALTPPGDPPPVDVTPRGDASDAPDARVDRALERVSELADSSPAEHVEIYDGVHRTLQDVLAQAAEQRPAGEAVGGSGGRVVSGGDAESISARQEDAGR